MSDLHVRTKFNLGDNPIVRAGEGSIQMIDFSIVRLNDKQHVEVKPDGKETVVVIMGGTCDIAAGDSRFDRVGVRRDVFSGKASAVYAPRKCGLEINGAGPGVCEVAVCRAKSNATGSPVLITQDKVKVRSVGVHNWRRDVHDIVDLSVPAGTLVVGETFNPPGNWSSYPPHRHEKKDLPTEVEMEEVYHFRTSPAGGFGFQRIYTDSGDIDEAYTLLDGDTVLIPRGYHPVAAAPGYRLYYLWILAGKARVLVPKDDPQHEWVKAAGDVVKGLSEA